MQRRLDAPKFAVAMAAAFPPPPFDLRPKRIVCLTEEPTETLYLLGEEDRIVGISGFTVRPKRARKEKPRVSTFLDAQVEAIVALEPDLVIGFSDIQAGIAQQLIARGLTVWINNHRSVAGILTMIGQIGALVGKREAAEALVAGIQKDMVDVQAAAAAWPVRPRVYLEEWFDPLISGIQWFSELTALAGGEDIFAEKGLSSLARGRIVEDPNQVIRRNPDIIVASWCGKMVKPDRIRSRPGWSAIRAVQNGQIHEIKSEIILQPGPAALMEGLPLLHGIFARWVQEGHLNQGAHSRPTP